jgi:hypothetical protein
MGKQTFRPYTETSGSGFQEGLAHAVGSSDHYFPKSDVVYQLKYTNTTAKRQKYQTEGNFEVITTLVSACC